MRPGLAPLSAALALLLAAGTAAAQAPEVAVTGGLVRGETTPDGRANFAGLPFAAPPVGALRWRPPQPVAPWSGLRDATVEPPACLQAFVGWNRADADRSREDCLYLDLATPDLHPARPLPVIVWIHGGANWAGSAGGTVRSDLVRRGVVLVAIQYRLGVFGFLSHPALTAEGDGASGNYGLMDQIAALEWVKANVARFGGDPDNITVAGESAGAQDVGLLNLSSRTEDLFARVIQQSGTAGFGLAPRSLAENEALGRRFATLAGAPDGEGAVAALRALSGEALLAAQGRLKRLEAMPDDSFLWLRAVVDGRVLVETPAATLGSGRRLRPAIVGSNAREIGFFDPATLAEALARTWGPAGPQALALAGGPETRDPRLGEAAMQLATDAMFRCPAGFTARAETASGSTAWQYQFDVESRGPVGHAAELPYLFEDLPVGGGASLQAYWVNFARRGDPNGPGLPPWPAYGQARAYMAFEPSGPQVLSDLRGPICDRLGRP